MGYTHYYEIKDAKSDEWKEAWPQLIQDAQKIVDAADVQIVGPDGDEYEPGEENIPPAIIDVKKGIKLNGIGTDNGHEPFILSLKDQRTFCKTARRSYDVVVCCILLRAYTLVPKKFKLSSDGDWDEDEWVEARDLYHRLWPDEQLECPQEMREGEEEEEEEEEEESEKSEEDEEDEEYKP